MPSHWCHRCNRFVRVWRQQDIPICSDCDSGFVEEIEPLNHNVHVESHRQRFPPATAAMYMIGHRSNHNPPQSSRRQQHCRTTGGDRSPFNPVIMLPGEGSSRNRGFELFYDDGAGSGLRPLPPRMSEFLLGSDFDRVMEQLSHVEANRGVNSGRHNHHHRPASKVAVVALKAIEIDETHMATESHCAVCKEPFELGNMAKEMPCRHIYHSECILPWLGINNTCPVCRYELASEENVNEEQNVGLTIWRLPGGGYAVGSLGSGEREAPVVYTEVDGGFNNIVVREPRRVSWSVSTSRERESSGGALRRMFNSLFECLRYGSQQRGGSSSSSSREREYSRSMMRGSNSNTRASGSRFNVDPSPRSRRSRNWSMDVNGGARPW